MNKPLTEFVCDCCGQIIKNPNEGVLEYIEVENPKGSEIYLGKEYKIVHNNNYTSKDSCRIHRNKIGIRDLGLNELLNDDYGTGAIITLIGTSENDSIVIHSDLLECLRRLTVPYYDEAKFYFNEALEDGFIGDNQLDFCKVSKLKEIIMRYSRR
jgi:hypothetical protein